jgi:hypothetical protein
MRRLLPVLVTLLCLIAACVQDTDSVERGDARAARRVLVAGPRSEFKDKVMELVAARLGVKDYYFKVAGLDALAAPDVPSYGAVVVIYAVPGGLIDERVALFVEKNRGNPKVIVFYTKAAGSTAGRTTAQSLEAAEASSALISHAGQYADQLAALIAKRF